MATSIDSRTTVPSTSRAKSLLPLCQPSFARILAGITTRPFGAMVKFAWSIVAPLRVTSPNCDTYQKCVNIQDLALGCGGIERFDHQRKHPMAVINDWRLAFVDPRYFDVSPCTELRAQR